jgi:hypothetical protein
LISSKPVIVATPSRKGGMKARRRARRVARNRTGKLPVQAVKLSDTHLPIRSLGV